jgi:Ca2+-binding RTX toxin-like protein
MRRSGWVAAVACALVVASVVPATASADNSFTCRASAARANLGGTDVAEPAVANRPNDPCAADAAGVSDAQALGAAIQQAATRDAYAATATNRVKPNPADFSATSAAGVAHADALANPAGGWVVSADGLSSQATAMCAGSQVLFPADALKSNVGTVTLGGHPIDLNGPAEQLFDGISNSPLGQLVKIQANEPPIRDGNTVTKRALQVTVTLGGNTVVDAVFAESKVGGTCTVPPNPPPCPDGYEFDQATGQCVRTIVVPGTGNPREPCPAGSSLRPDGTCVTVEYVPVSGNSPGVTVIVPSAGGPGGTAVQSAISQGDIPASRLGPCAAKKFANSTVIVGTDGDDTITGTKSSDIILAGGGNDRASGGDGNDCVRGELGNDRVDGSNANDTVLGDLGRNIVIGGRGNDILRGAKGPDKLDGGLGNDNLRDRGGRNFLLGGSGNNRIVGGSGRDFITTASGHNRVNAGRGNDQINAAKAGPATRGTCGPGRDVARMNANEMRSLHGCERRFVVVRR